LQGKPLNAWHAAAARVAQHAQYQLLAQALGVAPAAPSTNVAPAQQQLRYERVVLLFDPDADGIHIGALMQLYFARWLPALIEASALWLVRAPMFELVDGDGVVHHALTPDHRQRIEQALRAQPEPTPPMVRALRGIGGLAPETLRRLCVDPATRLARVVTPHDIQQVLEVFG
jgi:DNA gyrase subunit B/topoisomerase-4 subunit B